MHLGISGSAVKPPNGVQGRNPWTFELCISLKGSEQPLWVRNPVDKGPKLHVHKMHVQFTSCVYGEEKYLKKQHKINVTC